MTSETERQSDSDVYEQGLALLKEGRVDEGIERLRTITDRMPKALGDIAWAYRMKGKNEEALGCLKEYTERFPRDAGAWALMAKMARERNALKEAASYARRAAAARPREAQLWYELGEIFFYAGDLKKAVHAYGECLKLDPQAGKAHVRRQLAVRLKGLGPLSALAGWAPFRALIRRVLSSGLVGQLIEIDMGIVLDDRRWQMPLEWGTARELQVSSFKFQVPAGQEPNRFAAHFEQCQCPFWLWFRSLRLDGLVRRVLEVGMGPGHVAHHFARLGGAVRRTAGSVGEDGPEILSVTLSEFARRDREQRGITAMRGDFHLIWERGGSFDLIVANHALQHSRAPLFALWEWKRLLRPDGYLMVMAHLPLNCPAPPLGSRQGEVEDESPEARAERDPTSNLPLSTSHFPYGVPGQLMTLTYWQLRWLFKQAGFQLIVETLEDPKRQRLESVEHVDGRRPVDPKRPWDVFFLLRKPGRLPFDGTLEKPRPLAPRPPTPA